VSGTLGGGVILGRVTPHDSSRVSGNQAGTMTGHTSAGGGIGYAHTTVMEDSFRYMSAATGDVAVLATGDGDFLPTVESLQSRGLGVRVVYWSHAVSHKLRDTADEFLELDPYFDLLSR